MRSILDIWYVPILLSYHDASNKDDDIKHDLFQYLRWMSNSRWTFMTRLRNTRRCIRVIIGAQWPDSIKQGTLRTQQEVLRLIKPKIKIGIPRQKLMEHFRPFQLESLLSDKDQKFWLSLKSKVMFTFCQVWATNGILPINRLVRHF